MKNVPMKRGHQSVGTHDDRAFGELIVVLLDSLEVFSSRVRLADRSRSKVHHLVPVPADVGIELCHANMRPVTTDHREDMSQSIRPVHHDV